MKILFICKHNRFRSKVAESLFKKLNKKDEVKSAGVELDFLRPYVAENVKKVLKEKGIESIDEQLRLVNEFDIKWADKIIIVANNVSPDIFPKEKTEVWPIEDTSETDKDEINKIVNKIEKKVRQITNK